MALPQAVSDLESGLVVPDAQARFCEGFGQRAHKIILVFARVGNKHVPLLAKASGVDLLDLPSIENILISPYPEFAGNFGNSSIHSGINLRYNVANHVGRSIASKDLSDELAQGGCGISPLCCAELRNFLRPPGHGPELYSGLGTWPS